MEFTFDKFTVAEQNKSINAAVYRHGDLSYQSSVICYTRQRTAQVMMDYEERFLSEASRIIFKPGDRVCFFLCTHKASTQTNKKGRELYALKHMSCDM